MTQGDPRHLRDSASQLQDKAGTSLIFGGPPRRGRALHGESQGFCRSRGKGKNVFALTKTLAAVNDVGAC